MKRILVLLALPVFVAACSAEPSTSNNNDAVVNNSAAVEFANIRVEEVGTSRAVVRFETSLPTTCEVEYGLADDALDLRASDPEMAEGELTTDHEVPLEDLPADTEIFWRARIEDASGAVARSETVSFTTLADDVVGEPLQNFAAGATVSAVSSNFGGGDNDSTWGANQALDGQMSTEWASAGDGDDAMIEVDLGSVRKVTHVAFRSRKMSDGSSVIESFQVRFDGGDPVGPFESPNPDERYLFALENAQLGQLVTLEAVRTSGGNTGAKEIEFLGTPKE